jgi:peptidoglycan/LPS O-acetylase OafA/YrhL
MGAVRLFLAIAVLQSHISSHFLVPQHIKASNQIVFGVNGGYAVAFFFVISGFLISFVLEEKYDRPGGTAAFYRARALRIYPLWWSLYLIVPFVTFGSLWGFFANRDSYDLLTGFFLYGSDWLLSFKTYPATYTAPMPHGLELGWTLATELTFYLIAPFVLLSRRWPALIFGGSVLLRMLLVGRFPQDPNTGYFDIWCYYFFPSTVLFFMLGHLSRQLYKVAPLSRRAGWCALGFAVVACVIQDGRYPFDNVDFYIAILLFAAALPAIFEATRDSRVCNFLGDLSYPLYLSHGVLIVVLETRAMWLPKAIFAAASALPGSSHRAMIVKVDLACMTLWVLALLVAAAVHFAIEKPATRALRAVFAGIGQLRPAARDAIIP